MKLLTFRYNNIEKIGIMDSSERYVLPLEQFGIPCQTMNELIKSEEYIKILKGANYAEAKEKILYSDVIKCAPIPCPNQDVICLGINYMEHAKESAKFKNEKFDGERPYAVYFSKRVNEAVGSGVGIPAHTNITDQLDYEIELAVVLSRDAKNVKIENAFDYVLGYTILNDISARDIQTRHKQWYFGKSLDGSTPMGPWIVTKDEVEIPPKLRISSKVNGELRQDSSTDMLIFPIDYVISELSQGMTLKAGTIISMGTPAGVGMGMQPPAFLHIGDVVECHIEKIGTLTNTIIE